MKITSYLEQDGYRLEVSIQSKDVYTHSQLQDMSPSLKLYIISAMESVAINVIENLKAVQNAGNNH